MNKQIIARNFSRYARFYEQHATVQNLAGRRLLEHALLPAKLSSILEIGCGPGNFTSMLLGRFATARITAVDISEAMIETAQDRLGSDRVQFRTGDAETMPLLGSFDLVTSNASFQWLDDLRSMLSRCAGLLSPSGSLLFSAFGPHTFRELNVSLKALLPHTRISAEYFVDRARFEQLVQKAFPRVNKTEIVTEEKYGSVLDLLRRIKYTGEAGEGLSGKFLGKSIIAELDRVYKDRFGGIRATYEIFLYQAFK